MWHGRDVDVLFGCAGVSHGPFGRMPSVECDWLQVLWLAPTRLVLAGICGAASFVLVARVRCLSLIWPRRCCFAGLFGHDRDSCCACLCPSYPVLSRCDILVGRVW
jgi:hypothetical protein